MIRQLIRRIAHGVPANAREPGEAAIAPLSDEAAAMAVLTADPLDLVLHMEQVWDAFDLRTPGRSAAGPARRALWATGAFNRFNPGPGPEWDHLGYSYLLENSRAVQILGRVVREYRSGERLGIPSVATQRWLDVTEALLFGGPTPMAGWASMGSARRDPEAVRRNAYWRLLGMDLAFGTDDNRPPDYDKAEASNTGFVHLLELLLRELGEAVDDATDIDDADPARRARIFPLVEDLRLMLRARRQSRLLAREELSAATTLGWVELTLLSDTPVVKDLNAEAASSAERLQLIGERVGLSAHGRSAALFALAPELSTLLRAIESGRLTETNVALLYAGSPLAETGRRVITEWSRATGRDL